MKTLEEVIENKASFVADPEEGIVTKRVIYPEDYSLDFLKEKIKAIIYYAYSNSYNDGEINICFKYNTGQRKRIFNIDYSKDLLESVEEAFGVEEDKFFRRIPKLPFYITFKPDWWEDKPFLLHWKVRGLTHPEGDKQIIDEGFGRRFLYYHEEDEERIFEEEGRIIEDEEERRREEEGETHLLQSSLLTFPNHHHNFTNLGIKIPKTKLRKPKIVNAEQIFKSDECVICLSNPSNVLFCNCGHLCICVECDKTKSLNTCPVCKTETTIKRNIKY